MKKKILLLQSKKILTSAIITILVLFGSAIVFHDAKAGPIESLTAINAGTETFADFAIAGVGAGTNYLMIAEERYISCAATYICHYSYNDAIAAARASKGSDLNLSEVQDRISFVNIMNSLTRSVEDVLNEYKAKAAALIEAQYTAESWSHLVAALALPETNNDMNNNDKEVKYRAIGDAINALVLSYIPTKPQYQSLDDSSKKNIVVLVHGWNRPNLITGEYGDPTIWAKDMKETIAEKIGNDADKWDIIAYNWSEAAKGALPFNAYVNAQKYGKDLGQGLSEREPVNIHFIAHSAGSNLIQYAVDTLATKMRDNPPQIHMTFLDAYAPSAKDYLRYGQDATFAEQYVDTTAIFTQARLQNAINFDVTKVNPDGWHPVDNHGWPVKYYKESALLSFIPGFPYSLESGRNELPKNKRNKWCKVTGEIPEIVWSCDDGIRRKRIAVTGVNTERNILDAIGEMMKKSVTGIVNIVDKTGDFAVSNIDYALNLITGSPAWAEFSAETLAPANSLSFDYKFPRTDSGEGLFAVFVDGSLVYSMDETLLERDHIYSERRSLPETLAPGKHTVTFRLDPMSEKQSEVLVANIRFENMTSEEISDSIAPNTILDIEGDGGPEWFRSDVNIALISDDNEDGVGVKETEYSLDDGNNWNTYEESFIVSEEGEHKIIFRSIDWADNIESPKEKEFKIDKTAPEINISTPENGAEYVLKSAINADWSVADGLSGVDKVNGDLVSGSPIDTSSVGSKEFTVIATDLAGNLNTKTVSYNVIYDFGGFQSPVDKDNETFNSNSTIPIKFQLTDANGNYISDATAKLEVDEKEAVASGGSNDGNKFKYDELDNQYIFNLSVKNTSLGAGAHTLKIMLDDGTTYSLDITIK